jgi:hypothetical protein
MRYIRLLIRHAARFRYRARSAYRARAPRLVATRIINKAPNWLSLAACRARRPAPPVAAVDSRAMPRILQYRQAAEASAMPNTGVETIANFVFCTSRASTTNMA